jgi:hypothetical protein
MKLYLKESGKQRAEKFSSVFYAALPALGAAYF